MADEEQERLQKEKAQKEHDLQNEENRQKAEAEKRAEAEKQKRAQASGENGDETTDKETETVTLSGEEAGEEGDGSKSPGDGTGRKQDKEPVPPQQQDKSSKKKTGEKDKASGTGKAGGNKPSGGTKKKTTGGGKKTNDDKDKEQHRHQDNPNRDGSHEHDSSSSPSDGPESDADDSDDQRGERGEQFPRSSRTGRIIRDPGYMTSEGVWRLWSTLTEEDVENLTRNKKRCYKKWQNKMEYQRLAERKEQRRQEQIRLRDERQKSRAGMRELTNQAFQLVKETARVHNEIRSTTDYSNSESTEYESELQTVVRREKARVIRSTPAGSGQTSGQPGNQLGGASGVQTPISTPREVHQLVQNLRRKLREQIAAADEKGLRTPRSLRPHPTDPRESVPSTIPRTGSTRQLSSGNGPGNRTNPTHTNEVRNANSSRTPAGRPPAAGLASTAPTGRLNIQESLNSMGSMARGPTASVATTQPQRLDAAPRDQPVAHQRGGKKTTKSRFQLDRDNINPQRALTEEEFDQLGVSAQMAYLHWLQDQPVDMEDTDGYVSDMSQISAGHLDRDPTDPSGPAYQPEVAAELRNALDNQKAQVRRALDEQEAKIRQIISLMDSMGQNSDTHQENLVKLRSGNIHLVTGAPTLEEELKVLRKQLINNWNQQDFVLQKLDSLKKRQDRRVRRGIEISDLARAQISRENELGQLERSLMGIVEDLANAEVAYEHKTGHSYPVPGAQTSEVSRDPSQPRSSEPAVRNLNPQLNQTTVNSIPITREQLQQALHSLSTVQPS